MPDYLVTDPATGQRIKMTGPAPPSEALIRLALAKVKPLPSHVGPEQNTPDFGSGRRWSEAAQAPVGPNKGVGFLGPLKTADGVMSELSQDGEIRGMPVQYPLIVPTLTKAEVQSLVAGQPPTEAISRKAQSYAEGRIAAGKSPFAAVGEQNLTIHPDIPRTSQTRDPLTALQGAQTIGPARVGERYLEDLNPSLVGIARKVLGGAQRPASVAAEDPYGIGAWLKGAGPMPTPIAAEIQAYHGSPHDFEKFLLEKIGTGEGAQAYGHGLYFAENPAVAEEYRAKLGMKKTTVGGRDITNPQQQWAADELLKRNGDAPAAKAHIDWLVEKQAFPQKYGDEIKQHIDAFAGLERKDVSTGKTYHVSIKADPDQFLDWDKPLSQQSEHVQQAIKKALPKYEIVEKPVGNRPNFLIKVDGQTVGASNTREQAIANAEEMLQSLSDPNATGQHLYMKAAGWEQAPAGQTSAHQMPAVQQATERLKEAGIPGIKYLDQGSRTNTTAYEATQRLITKYEAAGNTQRAAALKEQLAGMNKPTSNYVVFDDKLIDILKKYAVAGAVGGSLASLGQQPAEEQK